MASLADLQRVYLLRVLGLDPDTTATNEELVQYLYTNFTDLPSGGGVGVGVAIADVLDNGVNPPQGTPAGTIYLIRPA